MAFHPDSLGDLTGKVYIVTGGSSGMCVSESLVISLDADLSIEDITPLLALHSTVLMYTFHVSTNPYNAPRDGSHIPLHGGRCGQAFPLEGNRLHGVINNAGIMATPFEMTQDGHEAQWQTNYLAHWVFTAHLLPLVLNTSKLLPPGSVRIVNLSSSGHYSAPKGGIDFADTSLKKASPMIRYGQSKLAIILYVKTLNILYGPDSPSAKAGNGEIWTAAVHPGLVDTKIGAKAEMPLLLKVVIAPYKALGGALDADKGSWTSVFCAASTKMRKEHSGAYFQRLADPKDWQSGMAKDTDLATRLHEWTVREMQKEGWSE